MTETFGEQPLLAGRYRLVEVIGRGGMGVVWHARDELIDRDIAVKQIHPPVGLGEAERAVYRQRALSEARHAGRISHAGIVAIHDIVPAQRDGDAASLVMELIAAPTLEDVVSQDGPLSPDRVLAIARGLREALETAHAMGVVHRDVKPANIHLLPRDTVKLVDFGIAHALDDPRLTHTGTMGTGPYMAPELFDGEAPHAGSDWWSLGVTLRHLVTGENIFARASPAATMRAIVVNTIPPVECPDPLATVIDGLTIRDPDARLTGAGLGELLTAATSSRSSAYAKGGTTKWPTGPTQRTSTADPLTVRPDWRHHDSDLAQAWTHGDRGDFATAIAEFTRLTRDYAREFGTQHRNTLVARQQLARWRSEAGNPLTANDPAELERLLPEIRRVLGDDDEMTIQVRVVLANRNGGLGDPHLAVQELKLILADQERVLGADHPDTLRTREDLAYWRDGPERPPTADSSTTERIAVLEERLAGAPQRNDHLGTLIMRHELACLRGQSGDAAAAVADLEGLLPDITAISPVGLVNMLWVFSTRHELARWRAETGDLATAITELESLLRDQENTIGAEHPRTLMTREELADRRGDQIHVGIPKKD